MLGVLLEPALWGGFVLWKNKCTAQCVKEYSDACRAVKSFRATSTSMTIASRAKGSTVL
jgi:hypothetical protein